MFLLTKQALIKKTQIRHTNRMSNFIFQQAKNLQKELTEYRRFLHAHAEVGFEMAQTNAFIRSKLEEMGYMPKDCGRAGLVARIGRSDGKNDLLLRADVDALPIREKTGVPYACKTGNMHACGHDLHAATLLGVAKLLKENEKRLRGGIKLLFQPAEEILEGANDCIQAGVLESVGGAAMIHVMTNKPLPTGTLIVSPAGVGAPAADYFTIEVKGKACHGSAPQNGVDALSVAAHILLALQEIPARENPATVPAVLTVGKLQGGNAGNAIADYAIMQGTLRAFDENVRENMKKRLAEIARFVAKSFRAKAKTTFQGGCPTLLNDRGMSAFTEETLKKTFGKNGVFTVADLGGGVTQKSGGSEDFAYISQQTPSIMLALAAGETEKGYRYPLHHPKVNFDENAMAYGVTALVALALAWGNDKKNLPRSF